MRALLTAFGPFLGRDANQSQSVLELCLRRLPPPWKAELLPVDLAWVREISARRTRSPELEVWLALGEAGENGTPRIETCGRNHFDLNRDPASAGEEVLAGPLVIEGPRSLPTTLPVAELAEYLRNQGHELTLSADSGSHCCNALLYCGLHAVAGRARPPWIGFLHLPRRAQDLKSQALMIHDALVWIGEQRLEQPRS